MNTSGDTIAAVATALGAGGVGIIRMSGPDSARILAELVGVEVEALRDHYLDYGHVRQGEQILDEVLYVIMRGPRSFTGEDVAEIHGHGGAANLGQLLRAAIEAGARHADAGEFTRRAFENRRIDLTRAEAIADIVNASSEKALRVAQEQLQGSLGSAIDSLIERVTQLLAEIEAGIDFPEENLSLSERARQVSHAAGTAERCRAMASSFGLGRVLRDGIDVVLRGPVNAGKSSLFNNLVGHDRALVATEAGTTRDYVEAQVVWQGVAVTLVDTAGLRSTQSEVEDRGIAMGAQRAAQADIELMIHSSESVESFPASNGRQIHVISKSDLLPGDRLGADESATAIRTSAKSGEGIEALQEEILRRGTRGASEAAEGSVVTNERQRARLVAAAESMVAAGKLIEQCAPSELVVVDLNSARQSLSEITGALGGDEMLDELFSRFCIGK
jgi:tRNA modification GTPase